MNKEQESRNTNKSNNYYDHSYNLLDSNANSNAKSNEISSTYFSSSVDDIVENEYIEEIERKEREKPLFILGLVLICISFCFIYLDQGTKWDNSKVAMDALKYRVSTELKPGTAMQSAKYENELSKDVKIKNNTNKKKTKIWVWDYADEDGDYVQISVNGKEIGDPFLILNKPRVFTIPAEGEIEIKGIKDGINGISYAIKFDFNGTSYLNLVNEGKVNKFSLVK
ncbi:hypothetical protein [Anaeromicropila herbilytica]|uniref:Uncharacterized protein n=1 Tax=Anaeromicropila herbilytica TaxID=2785025 RepID=A0A7R7ICH6_9FIRM|nr:hypothetical protein [Anaeromicropila herbilytica]BCN29871.1 hypothetical protein bsdtb5_11660 [Anaeromicropila herbilytica]